MNPTDCLPMLKQIMINLTPPIVLKAGRRLRGKGSGATQCPKISYRKLDDVPPGVLASLMANARGTHLNESGDSRSADEYLRTFDPQRELSNPDVSDNLGFLQDVISPLLPPSATIADIGCGIGRYARFLALPEAATHDWRYTGVERSDEILAFARRMAPNSKFLSSQGTVKIPLEDASQDLVMASSMLQYTGSSWQEALLEMKRVAKKISFFPGCLSHVKLPPATAARPLASAAGKCTTTSKFSIETILSRRYRHRGALSTLGTTVLRLSSSAASRNR